MHNSTVMPAVRLVFLTALCASWAAAAEERETRPLTDFNAIELAGGIDLLVAAGGTFAVEVQADDGELAGIVTEVRAGTLSIRPARERRLFNWGDKGSVSVTLPVLVSLTASGGSDVRSEGTFSGDSLRVVASGGSDVVLDVAVTTLAAEASGGSDLQLSGTARSARLQASGGSDLDAGRLEVDEADVQSSGGSDLAIEVREKLVANASGGSDVSYRGEPRTVDINSTGGSDVSRR